MSGWGATQATGGYQHPTSSVRVNDCSSHRSLNGALILLWSWNNHITLWLWRRCIFRHHFYPDRYALSIPSQTTNKFSFIIKMNIEWMAGKWSPQWLMQSYICALLWHHFICIYIFSNTVRFLCANVVNGAVYKWLMSKYDLYSANKHCWSHSSCQPAQKWSEETHLHLLSPTHLASSAMTVETCFTTLPSRPRDWSFWRLQSPTVVYGDSWGAGGRGEMVASCCNWPQLPPGSGAPAV